MSSVSNYFKEGAALALSTATALQLEVSPISLPFLGLIAAGQVFVRTIPTLIENCRKSRDLTQEHIRANAAMERCLDLSSRNLTQVPEEVSLRTHLGILDLAHNHLTEAGVSQNTQLRIVHLSHNRLTQTPDFSHNTQLVSLSLNNNLLTQAPDVSQNNLLQRLDISSNRIERLHDSIFRLPRNCYVEARNNPFSAEYCREIQQWLAEIRAENPNLGPTIHYYAPNNLFAYWANEDTTSTQEEFLSALKIN